MPIEAFYGETFVAFVDISGFKKMMRQRDHAFKSLQRFYRDGYYVLQAQPFYNCPRVEGIFITDCAILFVRHHNHHLREIVSPLLQIVEDLNRRMLGRNLMLTTSIAYGHFSYEPRIEFNGIEKNIVYGDAYVNAYLDNEVERPKLTAGLCRIVADNLPRQELDNLLRTRDRYLRRVRYRTEKHLYFYWMVNTARQIGGFEKQYASPLGITDHGHIMKALKKAAT